jgi:hypothetical protein
LLPSFQHSIPICPPFPSESSKYVNIVHT